MPCLKCAKRIGERCGCIQPPSTGQRRSDPPRAASTSRQSAAQQVSRTAIVESNSPSSRSAERGSGSSREVPTPNQQWNDKFSHIKTHLGTVQNTRMQSVNGDALVLAHKALEADCERAAKISSEEQGKPRHKLRFHFEMSQFALTPKSDGHSPDVMKTLFRAPVHWTMFEVPEYQGPLRSDCVPKWTMGKSKSSVAREGGSLSFYQVKSLAN